MKTVPFEKKPIGDLLAEWADSRESAETSRVAFMNEVLKLMSSVRIVYAYAKTSSDKTADVVLTALKDFVEPHE